MGTSQSAIPPPPPWPWPACKRKRPYTQLVPSCSQFVGQPIQLRVIEVNDGQHPGPSVAELRAQKERAQKHQLLEQSRSHPLVKQTLAIFGGDVVEVRQTAPQEETGHV